MNDGLVVLFSWVEYVVVLAALLTFILRRTNSDPNRERERSLHDESSPPQD
jgi:hypothetical protein